MSSVRKKFRRIVESKNPVMRGTVSRVTETAIIVSSSAGIKEFQVASPGSFKVGDSVKFQGNAYLGRTPSEASSKVVIV